MERAARDVFVLSSLPAGHRAFPFGRFKEPPSALNLPARPPARLVRRLYDKPRGPTTISTLRMGPPTAIKPSIKQGTLQLYRKACVCEGDRINRIFPKNLASPTVALENPSLKTMSGDRQQSPTIGLLNGSATKKESTITWRFSRC